MDSSSSVNISISVKKIREEDVCSLDQSKKKMIDQTLINTSSNTSLQNNHATSIISRHAIDPWAKIGSYYELNIDKVLDKTIPFQKKVTRLSTPPHCKLIKSPRGNLPNLLQLIDINLAQRLSIVSKIQPAKNLADVYNYDRGIDQFTRILHYSINTEETKIADEEWDELRKNKPRFYQPLATHVVIRKFYGIEVVAILRLPNDDQLILKIDQSLERICRYLRDNRLPNWYQEELEELNKIHFTDVYSNIPALTSYKSIIELQKQILELVPQTNQHVPCTFDLCSIEPPLSIDDRDLLRCYEIPSDVAESIEQHLLQLDADFDELQWYIKQNYPHCDTHPEYSPDQITHQWSHLQNMRSDEIKRIQNEIIDIRTGKIDSTQSKSIIDADQVQELRRFIRDFLEKLKARRNKEKWFRELLSLGFEYRHADKYDIREGDDDQALEEKLRVHYQNGWIVCGTDRLLRDHPTEWSKIHDELRKEMKQENRLQFRYVDFTDHEYKFHRFKVFSIRKDEQRHIRPPYQFVKPQDDEMINVLLLGESGVGKSTFINALANYLRDENFQVAEQKKPVILLPVSFLMTIGKNVDETQIEYDGLDTASSEDHDYPGQSVTQHCRSYIFTINSDEKKRRKLRLIDTPGFSDVRGLEQDQKNMQDILWFINNLSHLHAICFVMRPDIARLQVSFRSCLSQIFNLIGKNAQENILFCFTNTRATFYAPGNTGPVLNNFFRTFPVPNLSLKKQNTFCFDSESFRYLVAKQYGVNFDSAEADDCKTTWTRSSQEAERFLAHVSQLENVYNVHTAVQSRKKTELKIQLLIRPILESIRNHLRNMILLEARKSGDTLIELRPKHLTDYMALCHRCPRTRREYGQFAIQMDNLHVFHSRCLTCSCSMMDHTMIQYRLEYKVHKSQRPQSIGELKKIVKDLIYACGVFSYFLMDGICEMKNDRILSNMKRLIDEEKRNGEKLSESSPLNVLLVEKLEVEEERYKSVMTEMIERKEKANDIGYVQEWINYVLRFDTMQAQMDATTRTTDWINLASDFEVDL